MEICKAPPPTIRLSHSSPNCLFKPCDSHVHVLPPLASNDIDVNDFELGECATSRNEVNISLLSISDGGSFHSRAYSDCCPMPAYGPDGRTLAKGATVSTSSPRTSCAGGLSRRYNHSCDLTTASRQHEPFASLRAHHANPIAQVSSDILRVSGYSNQFRSLLSARPTHSRRESGPGALVTDFDHANELQNDEEKCNGGVHFDQVASDSEQKPLTENHRVVRRRQSGYGIAISSESTAKMRCRQRKQLFVKRNKVCDLSLLLALVGLFLAILDAEVTANSSAVQEAKDGWFSLLLRSLGVLSTMALLLTLINYHAIEVKIALIDSGADDWRVALTTDRIVKLTIELIVCCVCPFPGTGSMKWPFISSEDPHVRTVDVPIDVLLSVPMFLRSYLLCRFMVLHSKQFQDAATRSIAALNRISMDFRFVIKTMMADHPLRVLIVFTVSYWVCMSWMFTQCERYDGKVSAEHYYLNSMWFIMVTFMSIGYGDIVPNTYCGRTLSITTGIVGAGVSSALIAVISRKLELSRAEKHVNNFMADSKLTNQRKNAAASVLQQTWFIHKYQRPSSKGDDLRLRHHQRKFLSSINEFRRIKWDQRKLQEKGNSLLDVGKLHSEMHETLWEMHRTQDQFITQVATLSQRITELQNTIVMGIQANGGTLPNMVAPAMGNGQLMSTTVPTSSTLGLPGSAPSYAPSYHTRHFMHNNNPTSRPNSGASHRSQPIATTVSNPNLCCSAAPPMVPIRMQHPVPPPQPPPPMLQRFHSNTSEQSTPEVVVDVYSPLLHQNSSEN